MKKIISLLCVVILTAGLVGCGSSSTSASNDSKAEKTPVEQKKVEPTQEELNQKLKKEAVKADFVKINGHAEENKDSKVFAEGKISVVDYECKMDDFPSFTLSQKEGTGFGMYHITNMLGIKDLKDGDNVIIYGTMDGTSKDGTPKVITTIIEVK